MFTRFPRSSDQIPSSSSQYCETPPSRPGASDDSVFGYATDASTNLFLPSPDNIQSFNAFGIPEDAFINQQNNHSYQEASFTYQLSNSAPTVPDLPVTAPIVSDQPTGVSLAPEQPTVTFLTPEHPTGSMSEQPSAAPMPPNVLFQLVGQYSSPLKSSQPQQTGGGEHSELGIAPTLLSNNAPGHEPGSSVDGPAPMLDDLPPSDPELSSEESSDDERARAETPTPEPRALRSGKAKVNLARVATGMQEAGATAGSPMMKYSE